jgi:photosystem II stability/assembly factor-like uncharacterized protein
MKRVTIEFRRGLGTLAITTLLSACGGGDSGGGTEPPPPPTPLPETLAVTAPATAEAASELQFGNSASSTAGLSFSWDFGDGKTSTEASPKHQYSKGGDYDVKLKISNAAGASREQTARVSITNLNNVKGLSCSKAGDGGWCWQQPLPSGNPRNDSFFTSATTLFLAGNEGELFKSIDAGTTWTRQPSGVSSSLIAIRFSSAQHGWALTTDHVVLRTTDAGATWSQKTIPGSLGYTYGGPLLAIDDRTAIVGSSGLHTADGGETWVLNDFRPSHITPRGVFWALGDDAVLRRSNDLGRTVSVALDLPAQGYVMDDFNPPYFSVTGEEAVAVGWNTSTLNPVTQQYVVKHVLLLSFDAGQTWRRVEPKAAGGAALPRNQLNLIRASSTDTVLLASLAGGLLSSADGGQTWGPVQLPKFSATVADAFARGSTVLMPSQGPLIKRPPDLGGDYAERGLSWSADGGKTWSEAVFEGLSLPTHEAFRNLQHVEGNVFGMQDAAGRAFVSTDGGRTWKIAADASQLRSGSGNSPWLGEYSMRLAFHDAKRGLALGPTGQLQETADGGKTWTAKTHAGLPNTGTNRALRFVNDKTGWVLQNDGRLYKSTDGGSTWTQGQLVRGGLVDFNFVDASRGWGTPSDRRGLVYTRDGGQTWTDAAPPQTVSARGLHFGEGQKIFVYGVGALLVSSSDEGKTWTQLVPNDPSPFLLRRKVTASDAKTLWSALGTGLYRSDDDGVTWTLAVDGQFNDIAFIDARYGWAVGRSGRVVATTDGGKTWIPQATPYRELWRIQAVDGKTAWIEGEAGTVLATGSGGF